MMKLSIVFRTERYMGDHGEIMSLALDHVEGESVEALVERASRIHLRYPPPTLIQASDVVEIRIVKPDGET